MKNKRSVLTNYSIRREPLIDSLVWVQRIAKSWRHGLILPRLCGIGVKILVCGVMFVFSGCGTPSPPQYQTRPVGKGVHPIHSLEKLVWQGERYDEYKQFEENHAWAQAVMTIRKEIADPASTDPVHLAVIRVEGIYALAHYVDVEPTNLELDDESNRYFREAIEFEGNLPEGRLGFLSWANNAMAAYYSNSKRNGLAVPYMKKYLEFAREMERPFDIINGYDSLATAFGDMGDLLSEAYYRAKALELAKAYFILGRHPTNTAEWLVYLKILKKRAADLAVLGKEEELSQLWEVIRPIAGKYATPEYLSWLIMADYFAIAGEYEKAWSLFREAERVANRERSELKKRGTISISEDRRICFKGAIEVRSSQYEQGLRDLKEGCFPSTSAVSIKLLGLALEELGDLDEAKNAFEEAIATAEKVRGSYTISQRAGFFRSTVARAAYWGLIRTTAKQAVATGEEEDFWAALHATERIRARQLGDILKAEGHQGLTIQKLKKLPQQLGAETVLLDYILTDTALVLIAVTQDQHQVVVTPYNKQALTAQLQAVAQTLANPRSPLKSLQQELQALSQVLLTPVADLVEGKAQVIVLPDGALNLIPFDLLTLHPPEYRPLIRDQKVWVASSLRLFQAQQQVKSSGNEGIFAVGDPIYAQKSFVPTLTDEELQTISRGHAYLKYFTRLPETRTEVKAIATLFQKQPTQVVVGKMATESTVKQTDLQPFRYVHFATHGIIGGEVPGLDEPALVFGEEEGEDGFLMASEAEALALNADLTVLSACKTGTGEVVSGEGVMGMSRAFLVAGSRAVLVSLWSVASKETETLMVVFYRHLGTGLPPAAALRQSKLDLMNGTLSKSQGADRGVEVILDEGAGPLPQIEAKPHPFFWAPFILVGG